MKKKFRKAVSAAIAAATILSCFGPAFNAQAAEIEADAAKPSGETATGTIKFDSGDWNSSSINFYIWDENGMHATKNGWVEADPWGSRRKIGGTAVEGEEGVFESFEFELDDTHDYYVIFHDPDKGQTYDCCLNSSCFGLTAAKTGVMLENPLDSEKKAEEAAFPNGVGAALTITSTGKIQGSYISPNVDRADKVAQFVLKYLGSLNKTTNEPIVTEAVVADAIAAFETTANDVWAAYKKHSDHENYNEEEAKKVIKPTEEDPAPVDPDPVVPDPINPEPVDPDPVDPDPVDPEKSVTGTIKFNSGDWQSKSILFYIWDANGMHATKNGWVPEDPWGSRKKTGGTAVEGEDGVFESFEFEMNYNTDYFVIFYDPDHGQTFDCCMDPSCFGLTAYMTGNVIENPEDSEKTCIEAVFPNGMGPALTITSSGNIVGSYVSPRVDRADKVAKWVLRYLGSIEMISGADVVTEENVAKAIAAFETTADDVWKAYLKYEGEPNFNKEEAKKVIKPTEEDPAPVDPDPVEPDPVDPAPVDNPGYVKGDKAAVKYVISNVDNLGAFTAEITYDSSVIQYAESEVGSFDQSTIFVNQISDGKIRIAGYFEPKGSEHSFAGENGATAATLIFNVLKDTSDLTVNRNTYDITRIEDGAMVHLITPNGNEEDEWTSIVTEKYTGGYTYRKGDKIAVDYIIKNIDNIGAFTASLSYDSSVLEYTDCKINKLDNSQMFVNGENSGTVKIGAYYDPNGNEHAFASADGASAVTLIFTVTDNTNDPGFAFSTFDLSRIENGERVAVITPGSDTADQWTNIEVKPYSDSDKMLGDVDEDGEITANDAIIVLRASIGLENIDIAISDVDGDDEITANDAIIILRASIGLEQLA